MRFKEMRETMRELEDVYRPKKIKKRKLRNSHFEEGPRKKATQEDVDRILGRTPALLSQIRKLVEGEGVD